MRTVLILATTLMLGIATWAPLVQAAVSDDVATMANIVISLQHYPSEADKAVLTAIAESDSDPTVKTIAIAIANIEHKVKPEDDAKLAAIAADNSEPSELRELASIVSSVMHVPNADQVAALQALANQ